MSKNKLGLKELAHELKLPLFNIKSFLETLYEHNYKLTDRQRLDFLETANKETNRLLFLIENIIELESIASLGSLTTETFPISDLILQVVNSYKLTAKNKNIILLYDFKQAFLSAYGDSNLIGQVVHNLVGNSFKYSFSNKRIYIRTRTLTALHNLSFTKQEKLNFTILDEGIGISTKELFLIRMGDASQRSSLIKARVRGNTLGLKIVTQILYLHGIRPIFLSIPHKGSAMGFSLSGIS